MTRATMLLWELSDLADAGVSLLEFRRAALDAMSRCIGFDCGHLQSTESASVTGYGYDIDDLSLTKRLAVAVLEYNQQEIERMVQGRAVTPGDVFATARQRELAVLRPPLRPSAARCSVATTRYTPSPGAVGLILHRSTARFERQAIATLDMAAPLLFAVERLLVHDSAQLSVWAESFGLTARERQLADLVVRGLSNREIAVVTGCSELTVRNHLASIYRKAGVSSRSELAYGALTSQADRMRRGPTRSQALEAWARTETSPRPRAN